MKNRALTPGTRRGRSGENSEIGKARDFNICPPPITGARTRARTSSTSRLTLFGNLKLSRPRWRSFKRHTAGLECSSLGQKHHGLYPHAFRHTAAVHLLEAGVEVNVIRAWLGHVSLDTTNRYAEITLRTKQAAVAACLPPVESSEECRPTAGWRQNQDLMKWLESL